MAGERHTESEMLAGPIFTDLNERDPVGLFALGDELREPPNLRLGKQKKFHRWGILTLV